MCRPNAVSMTVEIGVLTATPPIDITLEVCPANGGACKSILVTNSLGGSVTIDQTDLPPLQPGGSYTVTHLQSQRTRPITVNLRAVFGLSLNTVMPVVSTPNHRPGADSRRRRHRHLPDQQCPQHHLLAGRRPAHQRSAGVGPGHHAHQSERHARAAVREPGRRSRPTAWASARSISGW